MDMPLMPREGAAHLAVQFPLGLVTAPVTRHVLLAYTEDFNIEFLNRRLRPYWQRNGRPSRTCWHRPSANIRI